MIVTQKRWRRKKKRSPLSTKNQVLYEWRTRLHITNWFVTVILLFYCAWCTAINKQKRNRCQRDGGKQIPRVWLYGPISTQETDQPTNQPTNKPVNVLKTYSIIFLTTRGTSHRIKKYIPDIVFVFVVWLLFVVTSTKSGQTYKIQTIKTREMWMKAMHFLRRVRVACHQPANRPTDRPTLAAQSSPSSGPKAQSARRLSKTPGNSSSERIMAACGEDNSERGRRH